jgi:hypothetical protein
MAYPRSKRARRGSYPTDLHRQGPSADVSPSRRPATARRSTGDTSRFAFEREPRRGARLIPPPRDVSAHQSRENWFQQRAPASGPGFRVDRQRDRFCREFDVAQHDGAIVHRRAEGLRFARLSLCGLPAQRLLLDPVPEGVALLPQGGRSSSAARIAGRFEFETS